MNKHLYNLLTTDSTNTYNEYRTEYVLTLEGVDILLLDENFIGTYGYNIYFSNNITGFKLSEPNSRGVIDLTIQYIDQCDDFEETVFCLVPMKSFIK